MRIFAPKLIVRCATKSARTPWLGLFDNAGNDVYVNSFGFKHADKPSLAAPD